MRRLTKVMPVIALAIMLAGCASSAASPSIENSQEALDALKGLGVPCDQPEIGDDSDLPYQRIGCTDLQIEWIEDEKKYDALGRSDCEAVPAARRSSMDAIVMVKGSGWVVRGNGEQDINAWPKVPTAQTVAEKLDGQVVTAADNCRQLGAWAATS